MAANVTRDYKRNGPVGHNEARGTYRERTSLPQDGEGVTLMGSGPHEARNVETSYRFHNTLKNDIAARWLEEVSSGTSWAKAITGSGTTPVDQFC